ncbi:hypothetical protein AGMMS49965_24650 [Bacteroidia bacterium]|nr:hypothetical protein AGMMS49965_24650 [Bacteroidia bacterium]
MKRKLVVLAMTACIVGTASPAFAQQGKNEQKREQKREQKDERRANDKERLEKFQKFKDERINYISQQMGLTDEEKAKFTPIEQELQQKKFDLYRKLREERGKFKDEEPSEADTKKLLELRAENRKKEAELDEEYTNKMLEVLPASKVAKYAEAEKEFGKRFNNARRRAVPDSVRTK